MDSKKLHGSEKTKFVLSTRSCLRNFVVVHIIVFLSHFDFEDEIILRWLSCSDLDF